MSKYPALFALAFAIAAGWTLGCYVMSALCVVARNTVRQWRTGKRKGLFR